MGITAPLATLGVLLLTLAPPPAATSAEPAWEGRFEVHIEGAAGEWMLLHHVPPRPHPRNFIFAWEWSFSAGAEGEPTRALVVEPELRGIFTGSGVTPESRVAGPLLVPEEEGAFPMAEILEYVRVEVENGAFTSALKWGATGHLANQYPLGVSWVVGADRPWTLNATVEYWSGGKVDRPAQFTQVAPTHQYRGSGATFRTFDEQVEPVSEHATLGSLRVEVPIEAPGWTHVRRSWTLPEEPYSYNLHYDLRFPNGRTLVGANVAMTHARDPILGFGPAGSPMLAAGTLLDVPGTLFANFTRLDPSEDVTLHVVHLPIAPEDYPADWGRWTYRCSGEDLPWDASCRRALPVDVGHGAVLTNR